MMEDSIPNLSTLFIPDTKPLEDDASTKVGDESDDEIDIECVNRDLRFIFEDKMRDNAKVGSHCHSKVAVLLIDWEKKSEGYLDTKKEVDSLRTLLRKKYHFTVRRKRLNTDLPQAVSTQLEKFLVDFKFECDSDESLLIIYYAGHGLNDITAPGTLSLHPTTTKPYSHKKRLNHIVWNQAEECIKNTKADILLIFDCCYAGELAKSKKRGPALGKIFDFLGASQATQRAWGPGPHSFTSALIWALQELASRTDGFTLQELQSTIQSAPQFQRFPEPTHQQVPCIGERGLEPSLQRLKMCPLRETEDATQQHRVGLAQHQPERPNFYLTLEFLFSECPTTEDIADLGKWLREIMSEDKYPLQHVLWRGLSPHSKWKLKLRDAVQEVMRLNGVIPSPLHRDRENLVPPQTVVVPVISNDEVQET
jgi:hypothetical protein